MKDDIYTPRFSFEISEELKARADKYLSFYGVRRAVMTPILEDLLDLIEKHGNLVIGLILDGSARPRDIIPSMKRASDGASKVGGSNG